MKKLKNKDNPYQGLRLKAISITPEQLRLQLAHDLELYGVVMDWDMGEAIATVVAFQTGDASIYLSTGQVFIGGYAHESVIRAARDFVNIGAKYLPQASRTDAIHLPNAGKLDFYFLTKSGRYYIEVDFELIESGTSALRSLFDAGDQVITEYRLIFENNE